jgi:polysaccharide pyruvyl transferase WcaK-like protein
MNILVYGFYNSNNIGDNLFCSAFKTLFPHFTFTFINHFTPASLVNIDAIFFGGGSFLESNIIFKNCSIQDIKKYPIFYIGVGPETDISDDHLSLLKIAKLIAVRSSANIDKIITINSSTIIIPDLVFALKNKIVLNKQNNKSILVLPNIHYVPNYTDPQWKYIAWESFKIEFAQALDILHDKGYEINFFSMCNNEALSDANAAIEIMNKMQRKYNGMIINTNSDIYSISYLFSSYNKIITQRFHGNIIASMCGVPSLSISGHSKFNSNNVVKYNEASKDTLLYMIDNLNINDKIYDINDFNELKHKISVSIC